MSTERTCIESIDWVRNVLMSSFDPIVSGIVESLGGRIAIAEALGLTPKAVELWERRGRVPGDWHLLLEEMAEESERPALRKALLSTTKRSAA